MASMLLLNHMGWASAGSLCKESAQVNRSMRVQTATLSYSHDAHCCFLPTYTCTQLHVYKACELLGKRHFSAPHATLKRVVSSVRRRLRAHQELVC